MEKKKKEIKKVSLRNFSNILELLCVRPALPQKFIADLCGATEKNVSEILCGNNRGDISGLIHPIEQMKIRSGIRPACLDDIRFIQRIADEERTIQQKQEALKALANESTQLKRVIKSKDREIDKLVKTVDKVEAKLAAKVSNKPVSKAETKPTSTVSAKAASTVAPETVLFAPADYYGKCQNKFETELSEKLLSELTDACDGRGDIEGASAKVILDLQWKKK